MHISMVNSLPSESIIEILSRLPADSVLQCKQVCKTWRRLLSRPSFAHKHLHQLSQLGNSNSNLYSLIASKVGSGFLFEISFTREKGCQLYYGEYNNQPNNKLRRINQPPTHHHSIVGSCNGLICYCKVGRYGPDMHRYHEYEPSYICNPITSEYVKFPGLKLTCESNLQAMVCGFGYHHSSNKYKIVKIFHIQNQPLGQVQVYTLGTGSGWRDLGETAYSLGFTWSWQSYFEYHSRPYGTFVNATLHWLNIEQKILSFDLADEKLYLLPPPPFVRAASVRNYFKLQALGGCLCFIHQKEKEFLDIWFFRKKGEDGGYDVNEQDNDSFSWIKEFSIPIKSDTMPFALTISGQVLFKNYYGLLCYDPVTTPVSASLVSNDLYHVHDVVPHMNSLVSLKGLGEDPWFRTRYDVNPAPKEIFLKQQRKDNGEVDVSPSLTMTQYSGKQVVSPIPAIGSDLEKSIHVLVGVKAPRSSKAAHKSVNDSRKRKSHCSDKPEKRDDSPQEVYCSEENSPNHLTRCSIREGGIGVGGTKKIVVDVEIFSDDDEDIGGTCGEVGATSPLKHATKRHRDGSDVSDQGSETKGPEPDRPRGQGVGQPIGRSRGSSLISPLDRSERGKVNPPLPEYTSPQLCPPGFLMVAGFPVLPEYKDLYTRVIASKGHLASDAKVKSMYIQATMVTELLETIQQMSELSGCDVTSTDLQRWRAAVDTASAMDFHVSWLDDQLHLLESQIRDYEEQKVKRRSLEAEFRDCEKRIPLLRSKRNKARLAYEAAMVDEAELIAKVATLKASLASCKANNQVTIALKRSSLGSCLATPH